MSAFDKDDDNDAEEGPRELTQDEKNLQAMMSAIGEFANKYQLPEQLPTSAVIVGTHLGKFKVSFNADEGRVLFQKHAIIELASALIASPGYTWPSGDDIAEHSLELAKALWAKAATLQ